MVSNKGILKKNIVSIIVAAVILALLVVFIVAIYRATILNERTKAERNFEELIGKLDVIEGKPIDTFLFQGGSEDWHIVGYSRGENKPDRCFFDSCICLCRYANIDSCQNSGQCKRYNIDKVIIRSLNDEGSKVSFSKKDPLFKIAGTEYTADSRKWFNCIKLKKEAIPLTMIRRNNTIAISHFEAGKNDYEFGLDCLRDVAVESRKEDS